MLSLCIPPLNPGLKLQIYLGHIKAVMTKQQLYPAEIHAVSHYEWQAIAKGVGGNVDTDRLPVFLHYSTVTNQIINIIFIASELLLHAF